ncbi:MAG TPA: maltose alpha-D-glucosyltransferase [Terracidiphilus sp.]|nr:maltose alpha-D-glucosyltransferase [Terracidiphilus sp.]
MKKFSSASDPLWFKDAIIYELHVRAFADSNGDGIGDFPGLISRLDYLQALGVTCIWLLPFFPSPLRDDGYDIANYVDVNPSYGTLDDFKTFLDAAHVRGMQVMIELVINHTSDQHPWFQASRTAAPGSPERGMYVWSDNDQLYRDARIIFTDTEKSNWTWDETAKAYYWHRFFSHQPDLNFDSPLVIEEVLKAMRFWLEMGVDGLRMDAIPYLVERDGTSCENLPETHAVIRKLRATIDAEYANRIILAEANQWPADVRPYFGDGDECHMAFHFPLMPRIYMALRQEDRLPITDIMAQTPPIPESCQWGLFLRNHDELTLEMVTDDERDYMYFAYSADPRMRVNVGIRRRLAPLVDNNRRRIELLNSLLLSFPGTPILYYGDEIGMGDNIYLGDRNGVRTPMQWTSDRNAGFSRCDPARLYFPVIMDPIYGYQVVNVEAQLADQSSLLHWTQNMIALRKLFQVFGRGTLTFLNVANRRILAYLRVLDRGDGTQEIVLCVANLSRFAQPVSLGLSDFAGMQPVEMLGYVQFPKITEASYSLSLAPYSFLWLELQPAVDSSASETAQQLEIFERAAQTAPEEAFPPEVVSRGWSGLMATHCLPMLEAALPAWMLKQRWFGAKAHRIQAAHVLDWVELPCDGKRSQAILPGEEPSATPFCPALFFVEVAYAENQCDVYQLPLAISTGADADEIAANKPQSIVTTLAFPMGPAVLHDAVDREDFRQVLLDLIAQNATLNLTHARDGSGAGAADSDKREDSSGAAESVPMAARHHLQPRESPAAGGVTPEHAQLGARASAELSRKQTSTHPASHVSTAEQSNTSIIYGRELILKLFRRLQPGRNPDVEIGRFLTDAAHFQHIAPFLGEITMAQAGGWETTVAMLQGFVESHGDGWKWFLDRLAEFLPSVANHTSAPGSPAPTFLKSNSNGLDSRLREFAGTSLDAAALLGRRTAEMHLALAHPTDDPRFGAEPVTQDDRLLDAERIEAQLAVSMQALKAKLANLDDASSDQAALLISRRLDFLERARGIANLPAGGQRIRIHGDYHLGQTLRIGSGEGGDPGDFVLLDFEGEPARPLAERRRKQSPLKDVAGMIRSFSYTAHAGLDQYLDSRPAMDQSAGEESVASWAHAWQNAASAEFLRMYRQTIAANPRLLPEPEQSQVLLEAYLLEKALYELHYELNNRPAWLRIPLTGILSL